MCYEVLKIVSKRAFSLLKYMPVSLGGIRGIGSITIRMPIQINPAKGKARHKSIANVANLH